jgi:GntR family transcriptional regulator
MFDSPLPLYHQIYLLIRQRLESGQFPVDVALPGENALAVEYGVSRLTIRRSLDTLQAEGFVERRQGRGTYASREHNLSQRQRGLDMDALMAHAVDMGMHTKVRLLSLTVIPASTQVAARLEIEPGAAVHHSIRVRSYDKLPFSHLSTYVPDDIGRRITRRDLGAKPLQAIFREMGIRPAGAEQAMSATLADPEAAAALKIPIGSALLAIRRLVRDETGRPVQYLNSLYRPDRYEYRMNMPAHGAPGTPPWLPANAAHAL